MIWHEIEDFYLFLRILVPVLSTPMFHQTTWNVPVHHFVCLSARYARTTYWSSAVRESSDKKKMVFPGTSSSPSPARDSQESSGSRPRSSWTEAETWVLIRLWEDHLPQLRGEKHNAKVYDAIVAALAESGILRTRRQVQTKLDNLTQRYR